MLEPLTLSLVALSLHFLLSTTDSTKTPHNTLLMLSDQTQTPSASYDATEEENTDNNEQQIREIHALTPRREPDWETHTHIHSHQPSYVSTENFSMSREFSALVLAGSSIDHSPMSVMHGNEGGVNSNSNNIYNNNSSSSNNNNNLNLRRIGEDDELLMIEETNPLAIVADRNPLEEVSASRHGESSSGGGELTVQRVRKEEVEAKIVAWQTAKVAKINNRFKREDAVIHGWENEQAQKATSWMKKVEVCMLSMSCELNEYPLGFSDCVWWMGIVLHKRKLEDKRAKALEKMQNEVAKAHRKAEERRASAEAKRGTKVARVLEIANLMRAVGRAPTKRSFF
ncbi:hypothetical protein Fmac_020450 [Flemingia macrophylla]|uniref:Remorin C-terminal domain-containing protein n=1 Tax=Flemingia macrophylla TaxID=520843 RepID=A0ABD1LU46_9FABA